MFMASEDVLTELDGIRAERVMDYARFILFYWLMRKIRSSFQELRGHVRRIQNAYRGVRVRRSYLWLRSKVLRLQVAGLVQVARQRVADIREDASLLTEYIPDVDKIVNTNTGGEMSLTQVVALKLVSQDLGVDLVENSLKARDSLSETSVLKSMRKSRRPRDHNAALKAKMSELADMPELLLLEVSDISLFFAVYTCLVWTKSGAEVVGAGKRGIRTVEPPHMPRFPAAEPSSIGKGALGWLSVEVTPVDGLFAPSESAAAVATNEGHSQHSNGVHSSGGARTSSALANDSSSTSGPRDLFASLRQGTLTLEEPVAAGSNERRLFGVYPMALAKVVGLTPAAFSREDVGKRLHITADPDAKPNAEVGGRKVWISGREITVEGTLREVDATVQITLGDLDPGVRLRDVEGRADAKAVSAAELVIDDVQDWVGGCVSLHHPKLTHRKYVLRNVEPAQVAADVQRRLVIEQECTLLWEGRTVREGDNGTGMLEAESSGGGWLPEWLTNRLPGFGGWSRRRTGLLAPEEAAGAHHADGGRGPSADEAGGQGVMARQAAGQWSHAAAEPDEQDAKRKQQRAVAPAPVRQRFFIAPPIERTSASSLDPVFLSKIKRQLCEAIVHSRAVDAYFINPKWQAEAEAKAEADAKSHVADRADRTSMYNGVEKSLSQKAGQSPWGKMREQTILKNGLVSGTSSLAGERRGSLKTARLFGGDGDSSMVTSRPLVRRKSVDIVELPPDLAAAAAAHDDTPATSARAADTVVEGFLLRKLHANSEWGRRYFVLKHDGQLRWYRGPEEAEAAERQRKERRGALAQGRNRSIGEQASEGEADPDAFGQVMLRFFAATMRGELSREDVSAIPAPTLAPCHRPPVHH